MNRNLATCVGLVTLVMCVALAGCGDDSSDGEETPPTEQELACAAIKGTSCTPEELTDRCQKFGTETCVSPIDPEVTCCPIRFQECGCDSLGATLFAAKSAHSTPATTSINPRPMQWTNMAAWSPR